MNLNFGQQWQTFLHFKQSKKVLSLLNKQNAATELGQFAAASRRIGHTGRRI